MACEKKPYNPGQKSLDSTTILIFFCHISVPLLKQCILFKIFLQFSLPPPYTKLKLGKILDTRVQHCVWGEGRGWTYVNWKTPQKCKSVPRLLSVIVDKRYRAFSHDVMWVILVFQNNETAAMLVSQTMKRLPFFGIPNKSCGS